MTTLVWSDRLACKVEMECLRFTGPGAEYSLVGDSLLVMRSTASDDVEAEEIEASGDGPCPCGALRTALDIGRNYPTCRACRLKASRERRHARQRAAREEARQSGMCSTCVVRQAREGLKTCQRCNDMAVASAKRARAERREAA